MRLRLFPKFVLVMLGISLVPLLLLGYKLLSIGQEGVRTAVQDLHKQIAYRIGNDFENYLNNIDGRLSLVAENMNKMDWENKQILLDSFLKTGEDINEISALDSSGRELIKILKPSAAKTEPLKSYGKDGNFKISASSQVKTAAFSDYGPEGAGTIVFYSPLNRNFVLRAEASINRLYQIVNSFAMGNTGFSIIVDTGGSPVVYPSDRIGTKNAAEIREWLIVKNAVASSAIGVRQYIDAYGHAQMGAYFPVRFNDRAIGSVIVRQSEAEANSNVHYMEKTALYLIVFFAAAVLIVAYFMSSQLSGPVLKLTGAAEIVARGDFSGTVHINSSDELKDLAETFNKMVKELKKYSDMQVEKIISEQKKTEAILFSIEDGMLMTDYSGRIQLANRKARSVLGLPDEASLEGRNLMDLIENPAVKDTINEISDNPEENFFRELEISRQQSKTVYKCFSLPVMTPGKKASIGKLIAIHDVTLEREIARIKDEFLHSITHDLRNPMGAIKGFVEFLLKEIPGPVTEAQKKILVSIDRASFRLLGMINNILDIAKMEAGKMELKFEETSVKEVASRALDLMESLVKRKNIRLVLDSAGNAVAPVDAGLIERVFMNLIGNAIKFTPENGSITLTLMENGEVITASVEDTGDGIPPEYLSKVFEKFEQVKGQKVGGTGLGLTICKYVVEAHLGRIWVESELGKGAKFSFTIPKNLAKNEHGKVVAGDTVKNENH
ncbi:MAG: HAMP domain-containing protein [Elusimicrobia bacterium]|nr:HAMP domain-containing protein [Elusimicrobiota bacterium]